MAEANYTAKLKFDIETLMQTLADCKTQATQTDAALNKMGSKNGLKSLVSQTMKMEDAIKTLASDVELVKSKLGSSLNEGFSNSLDKIMLQLSKISEMSANVFSRLTELDITRNKAGAQKELGSMANEVNALLKSVGINKQIDLELFSEKSLKDQRAEIFKFIAELNGELSIAFGNLDMSSIGDGIASGMEDATGKIKDAGTKLSAEVEAQIKKLEEQQEKISKFQKIIQSAKNAVNGTGILKLEDSETGVKELQDMVNRFNELSQSAERFKGSSKFVDPQDYNDAIEYYELIEKITKAYRGIDDEIYSNAGFSNINGLETAMDKIYAFFGDIDKKRLFNAENVNTAVAKIDEQIANIRNNPSSYAAGNGDDIVKQNEQIGNSYEELRSKLQNYLMLQEKQQNGDTVNIDGTNIDEEIMKLDEYFDKLGEAAGQLDRIQEIISNYSFGDIGLDEAMAQLSEVIDLTGRLETTTGTGATGDRIFTSQTGGLVGSDLERVRNLAQQTQEELTFTVSIDGVNNVVKSAESITKASDEAAAAVRSINDGFTVNAHTHPGGDGTFSAGDIMSAIHQKRAGYSAPIMAMGKDFASILNLDGVTEEVLAQVENKIADVFKSGKALTPKMLSEISNMFKTAGFDGALDTVDISKGMGTLVARIQEMAQNATEAQTPLEKLKGLIQYFSGGAVNGNNIEVFSDYWRSFEEGAKSAEQVFNEVMAKVGAKDPDGNLMQIKTPEYELTQKGSGSETSTTDAEADAHRENAAAINEEAQAREKLNQAETAQPNTQTNQELEAALEREKQLTQALAEAREKLNAIPTNPVDASELEAAQQQVKTLEEELLRMEGALDSWKSSYYEAQDALDRSVDINELENMTPNDVVNAYREQISQMRSEIEALTQSLTEAQTKLNEVGANSGLYNAEDTQLSLWPMTEEEIAAKEKLAAANEKVAESQNKINQAQQLEGQLNFDDLSAVEAKQKSVEASQQELSIDQQQNGVAEQQLQIEQAITAEKEKQAAVSGSTTPPPPPGGPGGDTSSSGSPPNVPPTSSAGGGSNPPDNGNGFSIAAEQKNAFVEANRQVAETAQASATAIETEMNKALDVAEAFQLATEQKQAFVEANKQVAKIAEAAGVALEQENKSLDENATKKKESKKKEASDAFKETDTYQSLDEMESKLKSAYNKANPKDTLVVADSEFGKLRSNYQEIIAQIERMKAAEQDVDAQTGETISQLQAKAQALLTTLSEYSNVASSAAKKTNDAFKGTDTYKQIDEMEKVLISSFGKIKPKDVLSSSYEGELANINTRVEELKNKLTEAKAAGKELAPDDLATFKAEVEALIADIAKYGEATSNMAKSNASFETVGNQFTKIQDSYRNLMATVNSGGYANASGLTDMLTQYEQAYQRVAAAKEKLAQIDDLNSDEGQAQVKEFNEAAKALDEYGKAIDKVIQQSEKLKSGGSSSAVSSGFDIGNIDSRRAELERYILSLDGVDAASIKFSDDYNKVTATIRAGNGEIQNIQASFTQAGDAIVATTKKTSAATSTLDNLFGGLSGKFKNVMQYAMSFGSFYKVVSVIKQGISYVREIDSALTELRKVTSETDETYSNFLKDMSQTAGVIGTTTSELISSAADWARLGYSIQEAGELAKNTTILMNVSEFDNISDATDSLISSLQAFKNNSEVDVGEFSMKIIDEFNNIGKYIA